MTSRMNMPTTGKSITSRFFALCGVSSKRGMAVSTSLMLCSFGEEVML
jgi:hypothetical protein